MLEESYSWPVEADYTAYLTAQRQHPRDRVSQSRPASLPRDPPPQDPSEEESESAYPDLSEFAVFYPWLLNMRTYSDGATPEEIQHAFGLLNMARETFRGVFDFRHFDRLVHDTRNIDRGNPPPAPVQARA